MIKVKNMIFPYITAVLMVIASLPVFTLTANAATTQRTTALNCGNFTQDESSTEEGWAWDFDTKTLTLTDVDFYNTTGSCITLPSSVDCTIVLVGDNTVISNKYLTGHGIYSEGAYTVKGTGTLTVKSLQSGNHAIFSKKSLTIEDCTINAENVCDMNSTIRASQNITVDNATLNITADNIDAMSVASGTITINDSTVNTNSTYVGLSNYDGPIIVNNSVITTFSTGFTGWYAQTGSIKVNDSTITIDTAPDSLTVGLYAPSGDIAIDNGAVNITTSHSTAIYTPAGSTTFSGGQHILKAATYAVQAGRALTIDGLSVKGWDGSAYTVKGGVGSRADNGRKVFVQSGTTAYLSNVEIKPANTFTNVIDNTAQDSDFSVQFPNLDEVVDHIVEPDDTQGDNTVTLSLNVSDIDTEAPGDGKAAEISAIKSAAGSGSEVHFFDVTLEKTVDKGAGGTQTTNLTSLPVPVEIHIALTGELAGKSGYRVFRYHGDRAEQILSDPSKPEYYRVDLARSEIVIYTMKFSTYAIFGNDLSLQNPDDNESIDVQAKVVGDVGAVYKVDISWGAMAFEWDADNGSYDPDTHEWTTGSGGTWTDASHDGVNNRVVCANHSNGGLLATFEVVGSLTGVTYSMLDENLETGGVAEDMPLSKVPNETDPAPEIEAFLLLSGEPQEVLTDVWQKVGVITVTFAPDINDTDKTPRS